MSTRVEVYQAIDGERIYQDSKPNHSWAQDNMTSVAAWILYMEEHLARAKRAVYELNETQALHEVRKVTALGVACMEHKGAPRRVA